MLLNMDNVPEIIKKHASDEGFDAVGYIGMRNGAQAFSAGCLDYKGNPIPMGMPNIFLLKDGIVTKVNDEEALDLL